MISARRVISHPTRLVCRLRRDEISVVPGFEIGGKPLIIFCQLSPRSSEQNMSPEVVAAKTDVELPASSKTKSFDARLQAVGQAVAQNLPGSSAILAARDARAGEVSRAPGSGRVMRGGHQNQLRIRRTKHETIRVAADFIFSPRPLFPTVTGVWTDVKSPPGDAI